MEMLRIITVTLAASVVSLAIGSLVASQVGATLANVSGYATLATCAAAAVIPCSATNTAIGAFTTLGNFFGIVTIALVGWYVISLFAGGTGGKR